MRRIIPYIASNFQNDRIWLRRSKPSKRVYQILIAVDDSSSMSENDCKQVFTVDIQAPAQESSAWFIFFIQMAYESLALISNSLNRLDCGQLGICRLATTKGDMQLDSLFPYYQVPADHSKPEAISYSFFYLRFGTNVEVLHPLDQPLSARSGGFVLQNLSFTQTQTNFKEVLQYWFVA